MDRKLYSFIGWFIVFQLIAWFIGWSTQSSVAGWYQTLNKSPLTPPDVVFPIVWFCLYSMIALAGWLIWQGRDKQDSKVALRFYVAQLVLNWLWMPAFFYFQNVILGFYILVAVTCCTLATIVATQKQFRWSSWLLIPYFLWLVFACYLISYIWLYNAA